MPEKLKIGIVGLGRLGKEYASHLAFKVRHAELIAACSISEKELEFAKQELGVPNIYTDYDQMLSLPDLDTVFVVSSTDRHVDHICKALQAGKHVFSEKPIAITLEDCLKVEKIAQQHAHLKSMVGFVRRYDPSYRDAKRKIDDGAIGMPFLVRSQTVDKDTVSDFQMEFVKKSGGIFHDFNVHDIDLARWYLDSEIKTVYAIGGAFKHPGFADLGDADNVMTTCQMANGTMAVINAGRTASHGHDTYTEIVGTKGTLRIGRPSSKNRLEIYDQYGVRRECVETFWERFEEAFQIMTEDFIDCVHFNRPPMLSIRDAVKATEAAIAFTRSFDEKQLIHINQTSVIRNP